MLYTAIIDNAFKGEVMITVSHLPAGYIGAELFREKTIPLSEADGLPYVEAIFRATNNVPAGGKGIHQQMVFLDRYLEKLCPFVESVAPLRIVVDADFAGELSGHYYYKEIGLIDNGILSKNGVII